MPSIKFTQVAATVNELYALDVYSRIWQWDGKEWELIQGPKEPSESVMNRSDLNTKEWR